VRPFPVLHFNPLSSTSFELVMAKDIIPRPISVRVRSRGQRFGARVEVTELELGRMILTNVI
jgi:hypothetical protein